MSDFNPFKTQDQNVSMLDLVNYFDLPIISGKSIEISPQLHSITYNYCKKNEILPVKDEGSHFLVAMSNPFDLEIEKEIAFTLQKQIQVGYCPKEELLLWIDEYFHHEKGAASKLIKKLHDPIKAIEDIEVYDLLDQSQESAPSIRLLNFVIQEAISQKASDIHFEPVENTFRIRYRIDGVLQNRHTIPSNYKSHIISRLKVMAKLDIAEMRRPQDGRIKLKSGHREIDFRVSTIPISNGERLVLRILDKSNLMLGFDHLGMDQKTLNVFQKLIRRSEGIVLVTGPTGSGKTTTLYSAVSEIYDESLNIMTIEDPIEYKLPGIAQIGVQPKINLTFAAGLRHILRQDPDVILIGEIRDLETAQIAIQSALTGHLVLSTLHTNDAPSTITRLIEMGIEPYLISSCVVGVLAQRLLRKICPHCKEKYEPQVSDLQTLKLDLNVDFYRGKGCVNCYQTGYLNRVGIYELMPITGNTKKGIMSACDSSELKKIAVEEGMLTLKQQGTELINQGKTTVEEVLRVALGMEEN